MTSFREVTTGHMNRQNLRNITGQFLPTMFSALYHESLNNTILAGLLTCSIAKRPSHSLRTVD